MFITTYARAARRNRHERNRDLPARPRRRGGGRDAALAGRRRGRAAGGARPLDRGPRGAFASRRCAACCGTARCRRPRAPRRSGARSAQAAPLAFRDCSRASPAALEAEPTRWRRCARGSPRSAPADEPLERRAVGSPARSRCARAPGTGAGAAPRPSRPTRRCGHADDYLRMLVGRARARGARARPRHLPRDGGRPRHERLDLHGARRRVDGLGRGLRGRRGARRAQGPAARRRARPGARHARRDRRAGGRATAWLAARARRAAAHHGHRPSHLPRARSARARCSSARSQALESDGRREPATSALARAVERAAVRAAATRTGPSAACAPTSSSTRRCCSTRSASRARCSRPPSRRRASAGWLAHVVEQRAAAGSSARANATSARCPRPSAEARLPRGGLSHGGWASSSRSAATAFVTSVLSGRARHGGRDRAPRRAAVYLPPLVAIPLHGVVQLVSNGSRTIVQREHVRFDWIAWQLRCR